ncbi:unnamed protein product [Lota lota]
MFTGARHRGVRLISHRVRTLAAMTVDTYHTPLLNTAREHSTLTTSDQSIYPTIRPKLKVLKDMMCTMTNKEGSRLSETGGAKQHEDVWVTPAGTACTGLLCSSASDTRSAGGSFVPRELLVETRLRCH